jgi:two-component system LytT family sensor kinase
MRERQTAAMSRIRRYTTIALAWSAAGVFCFTQDFVPRLYRNEQVPWQDVFIGWMAAMYICAVFTPVVLWAGRRWPIEQENRWKCVAVHAGFSALFSLTTCVIEGPVLAALGVLPSLMSKLPLMTATSVLLIYSFHGGVLRYWAVIGVQAVYRAHRNAQERERETLQLMIKSSELAAQLSTAQLSALKMQLQPHFLFNTLGAITSLVRQRDSQQAEMMIARLSDLLRLTLDEVHTQEVPLWRELEFLRLYLTIEQVRFQDRLRVRVAADENLSEALVPHMALQPLVENAVRHGLGASERGVCVEVAVSRSGDTLALTVTDDGPGSPAGFSGRGLGLANTRSRLERLYGSDAALVAENIDPRGVRVTLSLPFHTGRYEDRECA